MWNITCQFYPLYFRHLVNSSFVWAFLRMLYKKMYQLRLESLNVTQMNCPLKIFKPLAAMHHLSKSQQGTARRISFNHILCFYTFLYLVHLSQLIFLRLKCLFVTECNWLFHKQCVCFYDLVSLQTICNIHEPGVHSKFSSLQGNWASLFQKMTYMQVLVFCLRKHLRITYIMILCVD